ncbi:MAG: hypothetical protein ACP5SI_04560 [Chloroflexia bacterium]
METALIAICLLILIALAIQTPAGEEEAEERAASPRERARRAVRALFRSTHKRLP